MNDEVTLREYFDAKLKALCDKHELKFKALEDKIASRDKALELQAEANKTHFISLNNEAVRILKAVEVTVSRDTWNAFKQGYDDWVRKVEAAVGGLLPAKDFNEFKDATNKALQIRTGQQQGIGMTTSTLVAIIAVVGVIAGIVFGIATIATR